MCTNLDLWQWGIMFAGSYTKPLLAEQRARTNCHNHARAHGSLVRMFVMCIVFITCFIVVFVSTILTVMVISPRPSSTRVYVHLQACVFHAVLCLRACLFLFLRAGHPYIKALDCVFCVDKMPGRSAVHVYSMHALAGAQARLSNLP